MFRKITARFAILALMLEIFLPFHNFSAHAMTTLNIVDNNVNKNIITDLHGYCAGADFRYEVYWDDSTSTVTDVQLLIGGALQQTINTTGFNAGTTALTSPATYIRRNNSDTTPFTIEIRETADATNTST